MARAAFAPVAPAMDACDMMYVIVDRKGHRVVMPRYTEADAIEQIARAIVGRSASSEEKRQSWERLRDQQGFQVKVVATTR
jgi:hypothetical protein